MIGNTLSHLEVKEGKEDYDMVVSPAFSSDGSKVAYIGVKGELQYQQRIVIDGREGSVYNEVSPPVFSPDNSKIAYAAKKEGRWFIVVNGKEGAACDSVSNIVFSPDGRHIAYIAERQGKHFLVISNREMSKHKESPPYERLWQPVFSPDGESVLYGAQSRKEIWWKVESVK